MDAPAGTVYVVEDDASLRRAVERLARSAGLRAQAFGTGEAFLEAPHDARPACVVLDLRLPGMQGLEVQRHLARTDPILPVIVITGYGDDVTRREAIAAGAAAFLLMPIDDHELLAAIRRALASSVARADAPRLGKGATG